MGDIKILNENQIFDFNKITSPFTFNLDSKKLGFTTKDGNIHDKNN